MKGRAAVIILILALISSVLGGCKKGEEYVEGLDEKLVQAERLEDEVLARALDSGAAAWVLDQATSEGDGLSWGQLKQYLDEQSYSYLEGLGEANYSHKTLAASICPGGWIRVRQGWIDVSKTERYRFTYRAEKP